MVCEGLTLEEACSLIWLVDSRGLVHTARTNLEPFKERYAQSFERLLSWQTGARRVTDAMFVAAARVLAEFSPALSGEPGAPLYPRLEVVREVSRRVALAVGLEAQRAGLAEETTLEELVARVAARMWAPRYARYVRRAA